MDITSWPSPSSLLHLILHLIIFFQLEEDEHTELGCYIWKCWSHKMQEGQTPLYVVWRRVRSQSRTSVLALKGTRDTLSTWFHHMCWGHFVTAAGVILTNAYMIWADLLFLEHAFGFCTYFSLGFLFYSCKYSHPKIIQGLNQDHSSSSSSPSLLLATVLSFLLNFLYHFVDSNSHVLLA